MRWICRATARDSRPVWMLIHSIFNNSLQNISHRPIVCPDFQESVMTTIDTSMLNRYSSPLTLTVKKPEENAVTAATNAKDTDKTTEEASTEGASGAPADGGTVGGSSSDALQQTIDKIKEQIKQAQKELAREQAQLAAAQSSKGTPEEKAQRSLAIQGQISATSSTLQTLQGALLQLETQRGIKATA
ncbi:hypothetical protein ALQ80_04613 [Pseudomonas coronafaciens pv. oryzae]|nr:Uncharacterized protein ALO38_04969 [Pseudomonas coronafaciens pv. zizaniae]RMM37472.1 hypothetical protein ALQ80_04613 [Pseudomonas coronafaciens pv. oryzae]